MKIKIITKNAYLSDKLNMLNHSNEINLNKEFLTKKGFKKLINSVNKNFNNIKLSEDNNYVYMEKLNKDLKFNIYYRNK